MASNRKSRTAATRFGPALAALMLCVGIAGVGWCYLWQKGQISQLGRQVKERERKLEQLRTHNNKLRRSLGELRTMEALKRRAADLSLAQPYQGQVESLAEPPIIVTAGDGLAPVVEERQKPDGRSLALEPHRPAPSAQ